VQINLGIESGQ